MMPVTMTAYHEAVFAALRRLDWARDVGFYPQDKTALATPALYFSVGSCARAEAGTDQLRISADCSIWLVVSRSLVTEYMPELLTRDYAGDVAQFVEGQCWGLPVQPSEFVSWEVDEFDPALDGYHVIRVDFEQTMALGSDPNATSSARLAQIWASQAPDIGEEHIDDYVPLLPEDK